LTELVASSCLTVDRHRMGCDVRVVRPAAQGSANGSLRQHHLLPIGTSPRSAPCGAGVQRNPCRERSSRARCAAWTNCARRPRAGPTFVRGSTR